LSKKTIFINFSGQIFFKVLSIGLGIFTTRWIINNFSGEEYVTYNYVVAYNSIVLGFITMGLPYIVQKVFTNHSDENKLRNFWTTIWLLRLASYFLGLLFILITYKIAQTNSLFYIIGFYTVQFIMISDFNYKSVCDATNRSWQFSLTDFITKSLLLLLLLFFAYQISTRAKLNYFSIFILFSIACGLLGLLLDNFFQRKIARFGVFDINILKSHFSSILSLSVSSLIVSLYINTDKLILGYFTHSNPVAVGSYSNAYKIFEVLTVIPGLTMPVLASMIKRKTDTSDVAFIHKHINRGVLISLLLGIIMAMVILVFGNLALYIIDVHNRYAQEYQILKSLSFAIVFMSPALLVSNLLIFFNGEKESLIAIIMISAITLFIYFLLISMFSAMGAAFASGISYLLDFLFKYYFLRRRIKFNFTK